MYKGGSPRRTDARLGSAHARNYLGCRQVEAVKCDTVLSRGTIKHRSFLNEDKENNGIRFNEPATNLGHPAHDDE